MYVYVYTCLYIWRPTRSAKRHPGRVIPPEIACIAYLE